MAYNRIVLFFILTSLFTFFSPTNSFAQNKVMSFDGIDDYVDLGSSTGNNLRTYELWFKPNNTITPQNSTSLVAILFRNTGFTTADPFEFGLAFEFQPGIRGKLRVVMSDSFGVRHNFNSDTSTWNANQWYHVAVVLDSVKGMMLFINGNKQSDTSSYKGTTGSASTMMTLGRWGNLNSRYFDGEIDNVKLSASAIYDSNFIPECPSPPNKVFDRGTYLFQEIGGSVAIDSSQQQFHAVIYGANRVQDSICNKVIVGLNSIESSNKINLSIYPNPSEGIFNFTLNASLAFKNTKIRIYDYLGKEVYTEQIVNKQFNVDLGQLSNGIYFYHLVEENKVLDKGKLVRL